MNQQIEQQCDGLNANDYSDSESDGRNEGGGNNLMAFNCYRWLHWPTDTNNS